MLNTPARPGEQAEGGSACTGQPCSRVRSNTTQKSSYTNIFDQFCREHRCHGENNERRRRSDDPVCVASPSRCIHTPAITSASSECFSLTLNASKCCLTPVFARQQVIREEAAVQVRQQIRTHRPAGGVFEEQEAR